MLLDLLDRRERPGRRALLDRRVRRAIQALPVPPDLRVPWGLQVPRETPGRPARPVPREIQAPMERRARKETPGLRVRRDRRVRREMLVRPARPERRVRKDPRG